MIGDADALYLIDIVDQAQAPLPHEPLSLTVIFSSPKESHFRSMKKHGGVRLFMPLWSDEELDLCRKRIYCDNNLDFSKETLDSLCEVCGPIFRLVFEAAAWHIRSNHCERDRKSRGKLCALLTGEIEERIFSVTDQTLRKYFRFSSYEESVGPTGEMNYLLYHVDTDDYETTRPRWASNFVGNRWRKLIRM